MGSSPESCTVSSLHNVLYVVSLVIGLGLALSLACAVAVGGPGIRPENVRGESGTQLLLLPGVTHCLLLVFLFPLRLIQVSIFVDKPLAVVSIPANAASVPAPVVVDPAPIIVYEPLVVPVNAPVSDPVLVTEPVSPTPDVPVTDTNISVYYSSYRAPVAQLDEHWAVTREVMSSTPVLWSGITHSVLGAPVNSTCYIKKIVNCAIK